MIKANYEISGVLVYKANKLTNVLGFIEDSIFTQEILNAFLSCTTNKARAESGSYKDDFEDFEKLT